MNEEMNEVIRDDMWNPKSEFNACMDSKVHKFYFNKATNRTDCIICDQNILDCRNMERE